MIHRLGVLTSGGDAPGMNAATRAATRAGAAAADSLVRGQHGVMLGLRRGEIAATPLAEVFSNEKLLDLRLLELLRVLAT